MYSIDIDANSFSRSFGDPSIAFPGAQILLVKGIARHERKGWCMGEERSSGNGGECKSRCGWRAEDSECSCVYLGGRRVLGMLEG